MTPKLLSFLICSRKRVEKLRESIETICRQVPAAELDHIEFLLKFDTDDRESLEAIPTLPHDRVSIKTLISSRLGGYCDCWRFLNDLARISTGQFIIAWNDDAAFKTENWYSIFKEKVQNAPSVSSYWFSGTTTTVYEAGKPPRVDEWPCFSAHHRTLYEITKQFSGIGGTDSFLYYTFGPLGLFAKIPEIEVAHTPWFQIPESERDETAQNNAGDGQMAPTDFNEVKAFQARVITFVQNQKRTQVPPLKS